MKIKLISIFVLLTISFHFAQDKRKVALLPLENNAGGDLSWVASGVEYLTSNKLSVLSGFQPVERQAIARVMDELGVRPGVLDERNASQLGRISGADVTVSGNYSGNAQQLNFSIYYHNTANGRMIFSENISASNSSLNDVASQIVDQLILIAGVPVSGAERRMLGRTLTDSPRAFESFIKAYIENNRPNPNENLVITLFRQAISEDSDFWEAYYNLGIVYFNTGQYDQSLDQFNRIIRALPNFDKPYYGRGLIFEKQKRYDQAIEDFKKVIELNPNDYKPYYYLGKISIRQNDLREAQRYLDEGLAINPDYAPFHFEMGNLIVAQNNIRGSINNYRRAVELDPENVRYHQTLGEIYYRSNIYYNALNEFETILRMDPNNAVAHFMKGVTIYKQAVLEELVEAFLDLLEEDNSGREAVVEKKFDKSSAIDPIKRRTVYEDMVDAFTKASQARPGFMQATFNLALTYLEMGKLDQAERYFKATIIIEPKLIRAHMKLAEVYEKTGRLQDAIEQYKKVFYLEPAIFVRQPTLGPEHQYRNVLDIFMADLDEKIRRNPNDPTSNLVLAKVFRAQGQNGKAANILRNILSRNPGNAEAKQLLARIENSR